MATDPKRSDGDETQAFVELIERNGFAWLLEHVVTACEIEIETPDCSSERAERLTTLAETLADAAEDEAELVAEQAAMRASAESEARYRRDEAARCEAEKKDGWR